MTATMGAPRWPSIRPYIQQTLDRARTRSTKLQFEHAWTTGKSLSSEQAVALAMAVPDPPQLVDAPRALEASSLLTARELDVAHRIARGLTNKQIAAELIIAEGTADRHVANILGKLGFTSRAQVAAWVVEHAAEARDLSSASRAGEECAFSYMRAAVHMPHPVHDLEEMADMLSATTPTFPVHWDDPADARYSWTFERMHAPEPMTIADAIAFECAFDHGVSFAARFYGVPMRALTRRINTYLYLAVSHQPIWATRAGDERPLRCYWASARAVGRRMSPRDQTASRALGDVRSRHLDRCNNSLSELDASVARTRRLYEIQFPHLVPVHGSDQPVR